MDSEKTMYPDKVTFNEGRVYFKLAEEVASLELLDDDLATVVKNEQYTFCLIKGFKDAHVRCLIYLRDDIVYDQQYCFPQSYEVLGNDFMDLAGHTLAEMFFASYLVEKCV